MLIGLSLALASDAFLSTANVLNVLRQASLIFLLAAGLTLVIVCGGFDLSVAANLTLSACLAAGVIKSGLPPWLGVVTALACGTAAGALNGLAVTLLRLPPFLATYAMLWILQGLAFHYMGGQEIFGFPPAFRALGTGFLFGVPVPVYLMAAVLVVATVVHALDQCRTGDLCDRRQSRGRAAVGHSGAPPADAGVHAERIDVGHRRSRLPGPGQRRRLGHGRAAAAAGDRGGADRRHLAVRRRRQRAGHGAGRRSSWRWSSTA